MKKLYRDWRIYAALTLIAVSYLVYSCSRPTDIEVEQGREPSVSTGAIYQLISDDNLSPSLAGADYFVAWKRQLKGSSYFITMVDSTAYFTDSLVCGQTYIYATENGDTWGAFMMDPDGTIHDWRDIVFYEEYGENEDCFVCQFSWYICNTRSLHVYWYTGATCREPGEYIMGFSKNGDYYFTGSFEIKPTVPPNKVKSGADYSQNTYYTYPYDCRCYKSRTPDVFTKCDETYDETASIARLGCYLTCMSILCGYHGYTILPSDLNTYLSQLDCTLGYDEGLVLYNEVISWAALNGAEFGMSKYTNFFDENLLNSHLCSYGPQMLHVHAIDKTTTNDCHHFVVAIGIDEENDTYTIVDPRDGNIKPLSQDYDQICGMRLFKDKWTEVHGILIIVKSPIELVATDPEKRRIGLDPITGIEYNEVPDGFYGQDIIETAEEEGGLRVKQMYIPRPVDGEYTLAVTGTGDGTYGLSFHVYDASGEDLSQGYDDVPIHTDEVHQFKVAFDITGETANSVEGGYPGDSQRRWDINRFLSYFNVYDKIIQLPTGETQLKLGIVYGPETSANSFTATLNEEDIAHLFNPAPGTCEIVTIDLLQGSNTLVLSIGGVVPSKKNTDTDKFEIIVKL